MSTAFFMWHMWCEISDNVLYITNRCPKWIPTYIKYVQHLAEKSIDIKKINKANSIYLPLYLKILHTLCRQFSLQTNARTVCNTKNEYNAHTSTLNKELGILPFEKLLSYSKSILARSVPVIHKYIVQICTP
jgi:hypothetical protein